MSAPVIERFAIEEFLAQERQKDLLRFSTAGSVDDGKSTLIGRLLYDTQSVYEDQVKSVEGKGTTGPGQIDFALLTDGLRAEREQGITIDVAYRYFSTQRRKFIIADTPGHEQYTRNMATGASTADAAVVLIDASKGVLIQSRRHAYIASLLRVRHLLVAVNTMDLIGYDESRFRAIEADFTRVLAETARDTGNPVEARFIPVSALAGDNVVHRSGAMPWYEGPSLLELLEGIPASSKDREESFRFPVQRVLRPDHTFRGFAGQIASGAVRVGDEIEVLPSRKTARVARIVTFDGDQLQVAAPVSVTLVLDHEVDISRGDLIAARSGGAEVTRQARAALVWMDQSALKTRRRYLLKHASLTVPAQVSSIAHRTDVGTLQHLPAETLAMNEIGVVTVDLLRPVALEPYARSRSGGAFILVDPASNGTVAAGMVLDVAPDTADDEGLIAEAEGPVTAVERGARWGHQGGLLRLRGPARLIDAVERSLFVSGAVTQRLQETAIPFGNDPRAVQTLAGLQTAAGILLVLTTIREDGELTAQAGGIETQYEGGETGGAVAAVLKLLKQAHILHDPERAGL